MRQQQNFITISEQEPDAQCNNRLTHLRSQRFCSKGAGLCKEICAACQKHGHQQWKRQHVVVAVQQFLKSFTVLEDTCNKETQHYVRQMNEAQRNAIEAIARKKQEHLDQMEEIKVHLMKKTYRALEEKYTNLYEKIRNKRYDTLKCCQVFWVMNSTPTHHTIKHSEINKKLEAILKKFENFKEVSKNIGTENVFSLKQKIKKGKMAQKGPPVKQQQAAREEEPIRIQRVNYYNETQERYKKKIDDLGRQLTLLKGKKDTYEQHIRKLEYEINQSTIIKIKKLKRLALDSKVVDFKSQVIISFSVENQNQPEENKESQVNPLLQAMQEEGENAEENQDRPQQQGQPQQEHVNDGQMVGQQPEKPLSLAAAPELQKNVQTPPQRLQNQKQAQAQKTIDRHEEKHLDTTQVIGQKLLIKHTQSRQVFSLSGSIQNNSSKSEHLAVVKDVKVQESFVPWENKQLLEQMRKNGTKEENCLKVERIYDFSQLPFIVPPLNYLKASGHSDKKDKEDKEKPSNFSLMANKLFSKYNSIHKNQQKDKESKL